MTIDPANTAAPGFETSASDFIPGFTKARQSLAAGLCGCWACIGERNEPRVFMILCPTCGNKRCPKASNHRFECSNSNEPGQEGSVYK